MNDVAVRIIASLLSGFLLCQATVKCLWITQQCGYKNAGYLRWLKRKDNLFFNRLCVLSLCLVLSTLVVSLCFSYLGANKGLYLAALPFVGLLLAFCFVDSRYALKVKTVSTQRYKRLYVAYLLFISCFSYLFIGILYILAIWNGSTLYKLLAYVPFCAMPMLCPFLFTTVNAFMGIFETARNKKFVKRAGQVLDKSDSIRVGIVGSYGKTSVKNILKTILAEHYTVVETPESYNTPIGIAKTVFSEKFSNKQVFIAEMGARKQGDIAELCKMVAPDFAIFTGVCAQHIQTFGSLNEVWQEKQEILKCGAKKVVCGNALREWVEKDYPNREDILFVEEGFSEFFSTKTKLRFRLGGKEVVAETSLLGESATENILLAATLAFEMGLSVEEIGSGIQKLTPIPHRLQLIENNGVYILDDGYNCNIEGASIAVRALGRFEGRKCIVTPGIVEGGVLEEQLNEKLGEQIALARLDKVILVGETLVGAVKSGYLQAGGEESVLQCVPCLEQAKEALSKWIQAGDAVLFLNDLPDAY